MSQPDITQIKGDRTELEKAWSATHAKWAIIDTFTNGTYAVWPPAEAKERATYRSNRGRVILDHVSDNIMPYKPRFKRDEQDKKPKETQTDVDEVEIASTVIWTSSSRAEPRIPAKIVGRDMAKYSYGGFEIGFSLAGKPRPPERGDSDYEVKVKTYEERKANFNPFLLLPIHPYSVLIPPFERVPTLTVKRLRMYRRDINAMLEDARAAMDTEDGENIILVGDKLEGAAFEMLDVTRHYTPDYTTTEVGGAIILQEENRHGLVPFRHAFGGFGDTEANQDGLRPEKIAQGILWPVMELIQQYDQIRSAEMEIWGKTAFGVLATAGSAEELAAKLALSSQAIVGGVDVRTMGFLPSPQLPQFMAEVATRIDTEIVEATIPRPSFGSREVGVDTVGQHALMVALARNRFVETIEQLAYMTGDVMSMYLQMLATWGEAITVEGHRLSPAMLNGSYHITAQYPQSDEAVRMQRVQQGSQLVLQKLKSRKRFWEEDMMLDDTSGEQDQIDLETVMNDPILFAAVAEKIRRGEGVQPMYEEQLALMAAQGQNGSAPAPQPAGDGFTPPATEAQGEIRQALSSETVKPAPSGPGTGRRET